MATLLRRGSRLGKYRLDRRIGRGAFADVWRARDTVENRFVALKMLEAFFATPNHRHLGRDELLSDPDLASLKDEPAFRELLDGLLAE